LVPARAKARWRKASHRAIAQHVQGVYADCDADTLLRRCIQDGVACHTGARSCFFTARQGPGAAAGMHGRIEPDRGRGKAAPPAGSTMASLLAKGEAADVPQDRRGGGGRVSPRRSRRRRSTRGRGGGGLWFHTMVLWASAALPLRDVLEELARRHAARPAAGR
jgi:hypothetical protein